ncbi:MAG: hypothetical protein GF364_06400 [Candidatus Lokiarchaeota archaeon]|nr:hypothetical protein [Candidatus Lokiarchaeota archaeon]
MSTSMIDDLNKTTRSKDESQPEENSEEIWSHMHIDLPPEEEYELSVEIVEIQEGEPHLLAEDFKLLSQEDDEK